MIRYACRDVLRARFHPVHVIPATSQSAVNPLQSMRPVSVCNRIAYELSKHSVTLCSISSNKTGLDLRHAKILDQQVIESVAGCTKEANNMLSQF